MGLLPGGMWALYTFVFDLERDRTSQFKNSVGDEEKVQRERGIRFVYKRKKWFLGGKGQKSGKIREAVHALWWLEKRLASYPKPGI